MKVSVQFFGMVAEAVNGSEYIIENYEGKTMGDLEKDLLMQYPQLANFTYQLALDKRLVKSMEQLNDENEVAVLPPFAGG